MKGDRLKTSLVLLVPYREGLIQNATLNLKLLLTLFCIFFPEPLGQGRSDVRHEGRRCDTKQTFHAAKTFRVCIANP